MNAPARGTLHHIELWVPNIERSTATWGWLLAELGYKPFQDWSGGRSLSLSGTYIVIEQSPDMLPGVHERTRPGLNHLAFHAGDRAYLDALTTAASAHGWTLMFPDTHPHAGGPDHYAAYLADTDGYEVELVAHTN